MGSCNSACRTPKYEATVYTSKKAIALWLSTPASSSNTVAVLDRCVDCFVFRMFVFDETTDLVS